MSHYHRRFRPRFFCGAAPAAAPVAFLPGIAFPPPGRLLAPSTPCGAAEGSEAKRLLMAAAEGIVWGMTEAETGGAGRFFGMTDGRLPPAFPSEVCEEEASTILTSCDAFEAVVLAKRKGAGAFEVETADDPAWPVVG